MADGARPPRPHRAAGGGWRPNERLRTIVGVDVTPVGSLKPMEEHLERRTSVVPDMLLAEASHATRSDIKAPASRGAEAFVPVPARLRTTGDRRDISPEGEVWRRHLEFDDAVAAARGRSRLVERVCGLLTPQDGLTEVVLLTALAHPLAAHGHRHIDARSSVPEELPLRRARTAPLRPAAP